MRREREIDVLARLIDDTYAAVLDAARNPRTLDRQHLINLVDIWDNHLLPAIHAASRRTRWTRRRTAITVLRNISSSPSRYAWTAERVRAVGLDPADVLGTVPGPIGPSLDYAGRILPVRAPLTRELADLIAVDYDLSASHVLNSGIEVTGDDDRPVSASVLISAERRFDHPPSPDPDHPLRSELIFSTDDVRRFSLPHAGGPYEIRIDFVDGLIRVMAGSTVVLEATEIDYYPSDQRWHLSSAGQATTAAPEGNRDRWTWKPVGYSVARRVGHATYQQHQAMLVIRRIRYSFLLRRGLLEEFGAAGIGLGTRLVAAARRDDPLLDGLVDAITALGDDDRRKPGIDLAAGERFPDVDFAGGRLRFAGAEPGGGRTVLHLDVRHAIDGHGMIATCTLYQATGVPCEVDPVGLALIGAPTVAADDEGIALSVPLRSGTWTVHATAARWYAG